MTIVFVTNYMNHHQKPIADYLYSKLGDGYKYVITKAMDETFLSVGYSNNDSMPYVIPYYKKENQEKIKQLVLEADVMITGGTRIPELIKLRLSTKKLLIFISERWHKTLKSYIAQPLNIINRRFSRYNSENAYMLCASAFVPNDCRWELAFKNKTFKWGYFPPFEELDIEQLQKTREQHKTIQLLSVARMLAWKHPELPLKAVKQLHNEGYRVHLTMVGGVFKEDPKSEKVQQACIDFVKKNHLEDIVELKGAVKNEEVCKLYENADIFLFTSDRYEGWGAVLNEAMSRGCAVVASDMIGSVPYLIENGKNGLIFKSCNATDFTNKVRIFLNDKELRMSCGSSAYETILTKWNPNNATDNLLLLLQELLSGKENVIMDGPCSKAEPIKNRIF